MNDIEFKQIVRQSVEKNETLNVAFTLDPRYNSVLAEITQKSVAAQEPTVTQTAVAVAEPEEPGPLTRHEAAKIVQTWVTQDAEYELPERRTFEEMTETLQDAADARGSEVSTSAFKDIVTKYAPNAPHRNETSQQTVSSVRHPYPTELTPLVESGFATFQDGYWLVKRCEKCGQYKNECCGRTEFVSAVRNDEQTLTNFGRQAVGLDPIKTPKPPKSLEAILEDKKRAHSESKWWNEFRSADDLEGSGSVKMYIENFLPEGIVLISGLPKEGKSWVALSIAKALTSGKPLFGRRGFEVPEIVPVLYLAAESGDGALKLRCKKMGITSDKTRFLARTLSQGPMFGLDDENIQNAVRAIRPVVILETLIRFNDGTDEDSATQNKKLAESLFRLISYGARAVVGIHHSRKDLDKRSPTKEAAIRGSGDGLAMPDAVWLVMQDERLYQGGKGPNEIEIVGWGRDFSPAPLRLALTRKAANLPSGTMTHSPGIESVIDTEGDLGWVDKRIVFEEAQESARSVEQAIEQAVIEEPTITLKALTNKTDHKEWQIRKVLKKLGYHRGQGDNRTTQWMKIDSIAEK